MRKVTESASWADTSIDAMMGGGLIASAFFGRVRSKRAQNDPTAAPDGTTLNDIASH